MGLDLHGKPVGGYEGREREEEGRPSKGDSEHEPR